MKAHSALIKQILFFGIVGGTTLLIDVSVTYISFHFLLLPAYIASAVGFLSGFVFNFPMNRKKVFKHSIHDRFSFKQQIAFYVALSILNLFITSGLVELMVLVGIDIGVAKIAVTALIAIWNFLIFKFFVFSKKEPEIPSAQ